jgi:hypothetical protein
MSTHPNPLYTEWTESDQVEYLKWAYHYYSYRIVDPLVETDFITCPGFRGDQSHPCESLLRWLFKRGRDLGHLRCTLADFKLAIFGRKGAWPRPEYERIYFRTRRRRFASKNWKEGMPYPHGKGFRVKQKYQKRPHHAPKEKTEHDEIQAAWRKRKGFDRYNPTLRGPGKYYKQKNAQERRAWEKQEQAHERWDSFPIINGDRFNREYWD